jgi:hypothetical protein
MKEMMTMEQNLTDANQKELVRLVSERFFAKEFKDALSIIESYLRQSMQESSNDKRLEKVCYDWKALILSETGEHIAAAATYREICSLNELSLFDYIECKCGLARSLYQTGSFLEASDEIEDFLTGNRGLIEQDEDHIINLLPLLSIYADILSTLNKRFPNEYLCIIRKTISILGIEIPTGSLPEFDQNIIKTIKFIESENQAANKRYTSLLIEIQDLNNREEKSRLLDAYISNETVGFYRNLALSEREKDINNGR